MDMLTKGTGPIYITSPNHGQPQSGPVLTSVWPYLTVLTSVWPSPNLSLAMF